MLTLKRITAQEKPVVTRCRSLDSMTPFYLLGDVSGPGFGSGMWDHEGIRYDSEDWSTQWEILTSN